MTAADIVLFAILFSIAVGVIVINHITGKGKDHLPRTIHATWDKEAKVWWAECQALGLVVEADSLEDLTTKLKSMVPEMIEANKIVGFGPVYLNAVIKLSE